MAFRSSSALFLVTVAVAIGLFARGGRAEDYMLSGDVLKTGENFSNGDYSVVMQPDCNLVLYDNNKDAVWYTQNNPKGIGCELRLLNDGNLVVYDENNTVVWESKTNGTVGSYALLLQRDRNLVLYSKPIWNSGTGLAV